VLDHSLFLIYFLNQLVAQERQFAIGIAHKLAVLKFLTKQLCLIDSVLLIVLLYVLPQHFHFELRSLIIWTKIGWEVSC